MKTPKKFESQRLLLRHFVMKDAPIIFHVYASREESVKYISWPRHKTEKETVAFLASKLALKDKSEAIYGVFRKFDDQLLGSIGFKNANGRIEVGYVFGPEYWSEGYASEALMILVDWLKEQKEVFRIWANCDSENVASQRVLLKTGFYKEAIISDWARFPNQGNVSKDCDFYHY